MNDIFEIKKFYITIFFVSLLSLLAALYIEFFLGYKPCKLCIHQIMLKNYLKICKLNKQKLL